MGLLDGKTAIVTGAARGILLSTAILSFNFSDCTQLNRK